MRPLDKAASYLWKYAGALLIVVECKKKGQSVQLSDRNSIDSEPLAMKTPFSLQFQFTELCVEMTTQFENVSL